MPKSGRLSAAHAGLPVQFLDCISKHFDFYCALPAVSKMRIISDDDEPVA